MSVRGARSSSWSTRQRRAGPPTTRR
jgi:hypothetical protein